MMKIGTAGAVVFSAIACSSSPITATPPFLGLWGGSQFELVAYPDSVAIGTTCSRWRVSEPLFLTGAGDFQIVGTRRPRTNAAGGEAIHRAGHLDMATNRMSVTYYAGWPLVISPDTVSVQLVSGIHGDFSGFLCAD